MQIDYNNDGINDKLSMDLSFYTVGSNYVNQIDIILFFDVKIKADTKF